MTVCVNAGFHIDIPMGLAMARQLVAPVLTAKDVGQSGDAVPPLSSSRCDCASPQSVCTPWVSQPDMIVALQYAATTYKLTATSSGVRTLIWIVWCHDQEVLFLVNTRPPQTATTASSYQLEDKLPLWRV